ncbi:MAG: S-layer homology domain-containing protein [Nitrospirota bacterium]
MPKKVKKITKKTVAKKTVPKKENEKVLILSLIAAIFAVGFLVIIYFGVDVNGYLNVMTSSDSNSAEAEGVEAAEAAEAAEAGDSGGSYWFENLGEDEFTVAQCAEIKRVWDMGNWTSTSSSLYAPEACKALGFWGGVSGSNVTPPEDYVGNMYIAYEENPFPDTDTGSVEGVAAAYLYNIGLINGYDDGEFKGERAVNRAEAAKFLLNARYSDVPERSNSGRFSDAEEGGWYVRFVMYAAELEVISGYADGTFRPANTVNTAEFLKMLTLTFNLELNLSHGFTDVEGGAWYEPYVGTAYKYDLFPHRGNLLDPGSFLTRDEVATAIFQFLSYN